MKTTIEINGFEITIEENEGVISVVANKDGESIEEFTIDSNEFEGEEKDEEGMKSFGEEEEDFDSEDLEADADGDEVDSEDDDTEGEDLEEESDVKLESFASFIKRKKK